MLLVSQTETMVGSVSFLGGSNVAGAAGFGIRTYRNYVVNRIRYERVPPPYATIDVNPLEIEHCVSTVSIERGLAQVRGGEWDDPDGLERLDDHSIYRGLHQRYVEGRDWEETDRFEYVRAKMERHGSFNNYTSVEQFLAVRCEFVDELFASIRDDGYRPNHEGGHRVPDIDVRNRKYRFFHKLEPLVAIGSAGELRWVDGFHRVTIANLLGIDEVPVHVLCRHTAWQRIRDEASESGRTERSDDGSHPDLPLDARSS